MDFVSLQKVTHTYRDANGKPELIVDGFDWPLARASFIAWSAAAAAARPPC